MLPFTEMFGPSGPSVATRHGAPSSHADLMRSLIFWLIGIGCSPSLSSHTARNAAEFKLAADERHADGDQDGGEAFFGKLARRKVFTADARRHQGQQHA